MRVQFDSCTMIISIHTVQPLIVTLVWGLLRLAPSTGYISAQWDMSKTSYIPQ